MGFNPKKISKPKVESINKSLYLRADLVEKVEQIAFETNLSFNAVIVSMIEYCLDDMEEEKQ